MTSCQHSNAKLETYLLTEAQAFDVNLHHVIIFIREGWDVYLLEKYALKDACRTGRNLPSYLRQILEGYRV